MEVKIESSWKGKLQGEFEQKYFQELTAFVRKEYQSGTVYPVPKNIFRAFELCPFDSVKVVILGQDPYHGAHQANGLSFAVDSKITPPPSLKNIFKEIQEDIGEPLIHTDGDLTRLATQGVLLLNATLTVRASSPGSHQGKGWEQFTDAVIRVLSEERAKGAHIDRSKHLVLESAHPSPFSAANGFFGSKPFSKSNKYLIEHGETPINWL
jgi:uracil-DNA glycosylase